MEDDIKQMIDVLNTFAKESRLSQGTTWYVFGSLICNNRRSPVDLDLLVIYHKGHDTASLREAIENLSIRLPIDLYMMTSEEEREFSFIERTGALVVFPEVDTMFRNTPTSQELTNQPPPEQTPYPHED